MRNKKYIILIFSAIIIMLTIGLNTKREAGTLRIEYNGNEMFAFFIDDNRSINDKNLEIDSWYDEENTKYYLFLPDYKKNVECKIIGYGFQELKWNNNKIDTKDKESTRILTEGVHSLALDNSEFLLEVRFNSDISTMYITTNSGSSDYINKDREHVDTGMMNFYNREGIRVAEENIQQIRSRGNATWDLCEKKSYAVTLEKSQYLLPEYYSKKYVLISNALDDSYLRNKIMYDLGNKMKMEATPVSEFINVYIDGDFLGCYLLCSKIRLAEESVNITDLEKKLENLQKQSQELFEITSIAGSYKGGIFQNIPDDITGGYLLEYEMPERYPNEKSGFITRGGQNIVIKSPEIVPQEGVEYISTYYQEFEDALLNKDGYNSNTQKYYSDYIDIDSWVNRYLIEEISKNNDFGLSSNYFYKDAGKTAVFFAGPIWDYDCAIGHETVRFEFNLKSPEGLMAMEFKHPQYTPIYGLLYRHADFRELVQEQYKNCKKELKDILLNEVVNYRTVLKFSAENDSIRWEKEYRFQEEVDSIVQFLMNRMEYLDQAFSL